jgi:hypothetical protein
MPPVVIWAAAMLGALGVAKLLASAARKANEEIEGIRRERAVERPVETLERDPVTGEYRPRKH